MNRLSETGRKYLGESLPKLDTDYGSFKDLIAVAKVYTVPLYQRRYSWVTTKQVAELWGDIVRLYRERVATGKVVSTHFIGSVVAGETANVALGAGACSIIDGQQRITTLSLMLAAIRDTVVSDPEHRQEITENFLTFPNGDLRLKLSEIDQPTYQAVILGDEVADKRSAVYKAYAYIERQLQAGFSDESDPEDVEQDAADAAELPEAEEPIEPEVAEATHASAEAFDWEQLLEVIAGDLELVSISGVPAERAYQIFATLNHGGLKLSQVDLIRNAVFMKLPTLNKEAHAKIWHPLENDLGLVGLQRYLHAWVIRRGNNVPQKDTYAAVLTELKVQSEAEIYALLEGLKAESRIFVLISDPASHEAEKIAKEWSVPGEMLRSLRFLAEWGNVPAQPLLMEIVARWHGKQLAPAKAISLVRRVESLLVRRFIVQVPPNDLRSTLARLVTQVISASHGDFEKQVVAALNEEARRWPSDDELVDAMVTRALYRPKNIRQTFQILRRLAEEIEGKEAPHIQLGKSATSYSVEHVLPQTVEGTSWLSDMSKWGDPDPHQTWNTRRHTAGNLTLTAYNSELSNLSFEKKKEWIAEKLRLKLSTQILAEPRWTKLEIEKRSKALAAHAALIWPRK